MKAINDPSNPNPGLYRYKDTNYGDGDFRVELIKYPIVKETTCGVWILFSLNRIVSFAAQVNVDFKILKE